MNPWKSKIRFGLGCIGWASSYLMSWMQPRTKEEHKKVWTQTLQQLVHVLSSDWITFHQIIVLVLCVRDVIESQIDKCASYDKVCGHKENPIGVGSQWWQQLKIPPKKKK